MREGLKRIWLLDGLRGTAVVAMIVHHVLYDLEAYYGMDIPFLRWGMFRWLQLFFVLIFILTAGICSGFSRSNLRRGLIVFGLALALTVVTYLYQPSDPILFGILHFMGAAMLIYAFAEKYMKRIPWQLGVALFGLFFVIAYAILGSQGIRVDVPGLFAFGLPDQKFTSADYYPILPWIFAFLAGGFLSVPILEHRFPKWFYNVRIPVLETVGRNALLIFILHQPVALLLLRLIMGY